MDRSGVKRKIVYVSGTRADFGLLRSTLLRLHADARVELSLAVTGMHLDARFGHTVDEISDAGLPISLRVANDLARSDGLSMAHALAASLERFAAGFNTLRPDLVLVLGDRGEMLAGALAALHLNIAVAHIHGGERSGTIDESMRHAISKLSHYHFTATAQARERLLRMGEVPEHVFVTGAPGLDGWADEASHPTLPSHHDIAAAIQLDPAQPTCLLVFHPVVQQAQSSAEQMMQVLRAALDSGMQVLCLQPNADAGADAIRAVIEQHRASAQLRVVTHLARPDYLAWMRHAEVMLGNSSSGIIEAASFGLPVVNVGARQHMRERGANVIDCAPLAQDITAALVQARRLRGQTFSNPYGDGHAGERIAQLLATLPLTPALLEKCNAY